MLPQAKPKRLPPALILHMNTVGLAAVFLAIAARLAHIVTDNQGLPAFDSAILTWLGSIRVDWLNQVAVDITALGSTAVVTLFSVIGLVLLLLTKDRQDALHLVIAAIGAGFLSQMLKRTIERPRPEIIPRLVEAQGFSFPSGHALTAAAMYLTLAIIGCRYAKTRSKQMVLFTLSSIIVILIGASRSYLGVHYPSDVVSGISLGAAWALLLGSAFSLMTRRFF